jgi:hypothetical protein
MERAVGTFAASYVFGRWPEPFDSFEHVAVLGANVRVRAEPGPQGRILTALTFDVVRLAAPATDSTGPCSTRSTAAGG